MWDWDEDKRRANRTRGDYGERRFISTARLHGRVHVCVWTLRDGQPRIISLRKANTRERARHAAEEKLH